MAFQHEDRSNSGSDTLLRWVILGIALALIISGGLPLLSRVFADTPDVVQVRLDASNIQPSTDSIQPRWRVLRSRSKLLAL